MSIVGNNFRVCATCAYYECRREPVGSVNVKFDSSTNGKCYQTFPQGVSRSPMTSCNNWTIWPPINR